MYAGVAHRVDPVSPAYMGVEAAMAGTLRDRQRQPRACGGRGWTGTATAASWPSAPHMRGLAPKCGCRCLGSGRLEQMLTARGSGATEGGLGLLHRSRGLVQYAQPSVSRSPPSGSVPARGGRAGTVVEPPPGGRAGTRNGRAGVRRRKVRPAPGEGARSHH